MKKLLLSLCLVLFAGFAAMANNTDLFKLDYNAVRTELSGLDQLATMVQANSDLTYTTLQLSNANLVSSLRLVSESTGGPNGSKNPVLGIPSYLWGCGLGVVGMLVVYIVSNQDMGETKKALWGCLTWTGIAIIIDVVWLSSVHPF